MTTLTLHPALDFGKKKVAAMTLLMLQVSVKKVRVDQRPTTTLHTTLKQQIHTDTE